MKLARKISDVVDASSTFHYLRQHGVPRDALLVLHQSGARDTFSILSVLHSFPSLAEDGLLDAASISHLLHRRNAQAAARFSRAAARVEETRPDRTYGADAPAASAWQVGTTVPLRLDAAIATRLPVENELDVGLDRCGSWDVRNQGQRGTCVSFSVAALYEHWLCRERSLRVDLSPQFLHWAIKTIGDAWPDDDATRFGFALDALQRHGICAEEHWPYRPQPVEGNVSQADAANPGAEALADAARRRWIAPLDYDTNRPSGNAQAVLDLLRQGRPVGISVPVFKDRLSRDDNWSTPVAEQFGLVGDPSPRSLVAGGHAVCVTGFVPDRLDPWGGYFVFRNSWSPDWAYDLPEPGYWGQRPGYGQISASYVDRYLYEYASF